MSPTQTPPVPGEGAGGRGSGGQGHRGGQATNTSQFLLLLLPTSSASTSPSSVPEACCYQFERNASHSRPVTTLEGFNVKVRFVLGLIGLNVITIWDQLNISQIIYYML